MSRRPRGTRTWTPDDPLVLAKDGRPISSHRSWIPLAIVTTSEKGASLGSRSRMHQSGCDRLPTRLDQTWIGIVPKLTT